MIRELTCIATFDELQIQIRSIEFAYDEEIKKKTKNAQTKFAANEMTRNSANVQTLFFLLHDW